MITKLEFLVALAYGNNISPDCISQEDLESLLKSKFITADNTSVEITEAGKFYLDSLD